MSARGGGGGKHGPQESYPFLSVHPEWYYLTVLVRARCIHQSMSVGSPRLVPAVPCAAVPCAVPCAGRGSAADGATEGLSGAGCAWGGWRGGVCCEGAWLGVWPGEVMGEVVGEVMGGAPAIWLSSCDEALREAMCSSSWTIWLGLGLGLGSGLGG